MKKILIALAFLLPFGASAADISINGVVNAKEDAQDSFIIPLSGQNIGSTTLDFSTTTNDEIFQKVAGDFYVYNGTEPWAIIRVEHGVPHLLTTTAGLMPFGRASYGLPIPNNRPLGTYLLSTTLGGDDVGYTRIYFVFKFVREEITIQSAPSAQPAKASSGGSRRPVVTPKPIVNTTGVGQFNLSDIMAFIARFKALSK